MFVVLKLAIDVTYLVFLLVRSSCVDMICSVWSNWRLDVIFFFHFLYFVLVFGFIDAFGSPKQDQCEDITAASSHVWMGKIWVTPLWGFGTFPVWHPPPTNTHTLLHTLTPPTHILCSLPESKYSAALWASATFQLTALLLVLIISFILNPLFRWFHLSVWVLTHFRQRSTKTASHLATRS